MAASDSILKIVVQAKDDASKVLRGVQSDIKDVGKTGEDISKGLRNTGLAITAVGAGLTLISKSATDSVVDYAKGVMKLSRETGESTENMSRLFYAIQRSGVSAEEASGLFGFFSKQINEANKKSGEAALKQQDLQVEIALTQKKIAALTEEKKKDGDKTGELSLKIQKLNIDLAKYQQELTDTANPLQKLGINTKNADGSQRSFSQILLEVSDRFKGMPDGAEKTATAMELFGRSGKDIIPILNQGSQGLQELMKKADELGVTLTADNLTKVKSYITAQKNLKDSTTELSMTIGREALPMWTKMAQVTNDAVQALLRAPEPIRGATTAVVAFGGPVATATGGFLAFAASAKDAWPVIAGTTSKFGPAGLAITGAAIALTGYTIGLDTLKNKGIITQQQIDLFHGSIARTGETVIPTIPIIRELGDSMFKGSLSAMQHKMANDNLKRSLDEVNLASQTLKDTQLIQQGSALGVERAQRNYNEAVKQFGPNSLEAREGAYYLEQAQANLKTANDKTKSAQDQLTQKEKEYADKQKDVTKEVDTRSKNTQGIVERMVGKIAQLLGGSADEAGRSGAGFMDALAAGMKRNENKPKSTLDGILSSLRRLLPFSDAKTGPLSDLTLSGQRFSETFAYGIAKGQGSITSAVDRALSSISLPGMTVPVTASAMGVSQPALSPVGVGGVTIYQTNNIHTPTDMEANNRELGWRLAT